MDAITGWLILPMILGCIATSVAFLTDSQRFFRFSFLAISGILTLLTVAVFRGSVSWTGPTLFALDSFHQVRCHFKVSLAQIPLLWITWWWMSNGQRVQHPSERFWFLAVLMAFLVCDDVWLWMVTFIVCSALQQFRLTSSRRFREGLGLLRGSHWLAILLLLVVVGILSFDFGIGAFHELPELLQSWENFTETQQADLVLAALLGSLSLILISAVYPISVLRVDCETNNDLEILSLLLAAAVSLKLTPLFLVTNVTSIHLTLILVTVAISMVCSWGLVETRPRRRALLMALLMLGLFGMFLSEEPVMNHLGLEQFLLVVIMWRLWSRDETRSLSQQAAMLLLGLWVLVGMTGWNLALQSSGLLGDNETVVSIVTVVLSAGLAAPFFYELLADWKALSGDNDLNTQTRKSGLSIIPVVVVVASSRYGLVKQGEPWLIVPGWQATLGVVVSVVVSVGMTGLLTRRSSLKQVSYHREGNLQRFVESHFHGLTIWKGLASIPSGVVAACASVVDLWQSRVQHRFRHRDEPWKSPSSFGWEVALGAISFLLLASLFLWMKG